MKRGLGLGGVLMGTLLLAACTLPTGVSDKTLSAVGYLPPTTAEIPLKTGPTASTFDYPVMFGTTRKALSAGAGFSDDRDEALHYGRVFVTIPKNHRVGSLGSDIGTYFGSDPKLTVNRFESIPGEAQFLAIAQRELRPVTGPENGYVVVFIHGYNNSFNDAALRAAQLGADLDVPANNMFLFSWAARSDVIKYTFDEATVDTSEVYFRSFLETVAKAANGRKIHIVAHSMGNRALLRVIASGVNTVSSERGIRFGQIILAAADVDRDLFAQLAPNYLKVSDRTTVYLSPYDYAVAASSHVHDYPRVGCGTAPQVIVPGIDNVVSNLPDDFPSHAYFAETLPLLTDIKNLMLRNTPARSGDKWKRVDGYWVVGGSPNNAKVVCRTRNTLMPAAR
ncbi:hypothetical protein PIN31115_02899 [Pandoraea iniqua]|uniref:Alpha/beta hydrolase n=1 Tax=Pandoraea iniqua TaxID=2508288 RepID=A0A5E4VZG9_9BURK|nr:alpha/beta hydrolase [Pandoraea iniqua]VVE16420.1 hypothetical protein PIN31115_02899 [Pandoraea iniqua]